MKAATPVLPAINKRTIKVSRIKIIGKLHHNLYFHNVWKNSAEIANRKYIFLKNFFILLCTYYSSNFPSSPTLFSHVQCLRM